MDRTRLPIEDPEFTGTIGRTYQESEAAWPELPQPPDGAPNVVLIMLDDTGFGQTGTFGGPVRTPELDRLAAEGIWHNRFDTTAICGPSRDAFVDRRNHHNAGSGFLVEWATGFPSYTSMIPQSTATIGRILKRQALTQSAP